MNSADYDKELAKDQRAPKNNALRAQKLSASFALKISLAIDGRKFATPWLCVRSDIKRKIPIVHASPYLEATYVIPEV